MILKPYKEVFSLHDSKIYAIDRRGNDLEISLSSMVIFEKINLLLSIILILYAMTL